MIAKKNEILTSTSLPLEERRAILLGIFYDAEKNAFTQKIVKQSFEYVGLYPWNPERILEICVKNAPTSSLHETDQSLIYLAEAIKKYREDQVN